MNTNIFHRTGKVLLIYTGGTIGMGRNPRTGALEPLDFRLLLERTPEVKLLSASVETYQFNPIIDSSDMSPRLWAQLVRIISNSYDDYDGFVILHGTDTMAYTASAVSFMLENLTKPVIFTGSQLPIGQLRTDGKENLMTSLELAIAHNEDGTPRVQSASTSTGSSSEATAAQNATPTASTPLRVSTTRTSATRV